METQTYTTVRGRFQIEGADEMYARIETAGRYRSAVPGSQDPTLAPDSYFPSLNISAPIRQSHSAPQPGAVARIASSPLAWVLLFALIAGGIVWNVVLFR